MPEWARATWKRSRFSATVSKIALTDSRFHPCCISRPRSTVRRSHEQGGRPCSKETVGATPPFSLERPQEIDDFLLLLRVQPIELLDDLVCFAAPALVSSDGIYQVIGPSVMEEEGTLSYAP